MTDCPLDSSDETLMYWLRPEEILRYDERDRVEDLMLLFREQLERIVKDPDAPQGCEMVAARAMAAQIWTFDRLTSNGKVVRQQVEAQTDYREAYRAYFVSSESEFHQRALVLRGLAQTEAILRDMRASIGGELKTWGPRLVDSAG